MEGTLDECIAGLLAKPRSQQHLYEVHTGRQGELVNAVMNAESVRHLEECRAKAKPRSLEGPGPFTPEGKVWANG
jgi:hypothetical protein